MSEYIKFSCEQVAPKITSFDGLAELNAYRRNLLDLGLIGMDPKGIGFGNLSVRDGASDSFYVTGSATGGIPELTLADCAKVVACNFEANRVLYEGSSLPSSESLTHASIYESDASAGAIIHCHDSKLWTELLDQAPTSSKNGYYGTRELAYEIMQLLTSTDVQSRRIIVMAGHQGGILTFGKDLGQAFRVLRRERDRIASE